jgi:hypothetical protein
MMMAKKKREGIIGYFFGLPGEKARLLRGNLLLIGSITAVSLLFFVYLSLTRAIFDITVLPDYDFPPRLTAEGTAVNAYLLSTENRGRADLNIELKTRKAAGAGEIKLTPSHMYLKADERRKVRVYAVMEAVLEKGNLPFVIEATSGDNGKTVIEKKVYFKVPEGK